MQIGYMTTLAQPEGVAYDRILDELREQAVLCDQGGFEHLWLAEHHFGTDGHDNSPNPFMLATDVGARTRRIKLGVAVVILPMWHPLRVAENITLLDQMLKGRIAEIGFGRASRPHEVTSLNPAADPKNVDASRALFEECFEIVSKACSEKYFEHVGEHYRIPPENTPWTTAKGIEPDPEWVRDGKIFQLGIVPKPYQRPHPTFSMACSSDSSVEFCAKLGLRAMAWRQPPLMLKQWIERYARAMEHNGHSVDDPAGNWSVLRNIYVAPTTEEARRDYEPAVMSETRYRAADPWRALRAYLNPGEEPAPGTELDWDFLTGRSIIAGSPESVVEQLLELKEITGVRTVLAGVGTRGVPHKKLMRCLELISERVIPALQDAGDAAAGARA